MCVSVFIEHKPQCSLSKLKRLRWSKRRTFVEGSAKDDKKCPVILFAWHRKFKWSCKQPTLVLLRVFGCFFRNRKSYKKEEKRIANCSFSTPRFVYEYLWWNEIGKHMTTRHHAKQAQKQKARRLLIVSQTGGWGPRPSQILNSSISLSRTMKRYFSVYGNERSGPAETRRPEISHFNDALVSFWLSRRTVNDWLTDSSFVHVGVDAYVQLRIRSLLHCFSGTDGNWPLSSSEAFF